MAASSLFRNNYSTNSHLRDTFRRILAKKRKFEKMVIPISDARRRYKCPRGSSREKLAQYTTLTTTEGSRGTVVVPAPERATASTEETFSDFPTKGHEQKDNPTTTVRPAVTNDARFCHNVFDLLFKTLPPVGRADSAVKSSSVFENSRRCEIIPDSESAYFKEMFASDKYSAFFSPFVPSVISLYETKTNPFILKFERFLFINRGNFSTIVFIVSQCPLERLYFLNSTEERISSIRVAVENSHSVANWRIEIDIRSDRAFFQNCSSLLTRYRERRTQPIIQDASTDASHLCCCSKKHTITVSKENVSLSSNRPCQYVVQIALKLSDLLEQEITFAPSRHMLTEHTQTQIFEATLVLSASYDNYFHIEDLQWICIMMADVVGLEDASSSGAHALTLKNDMLSSEAVCTHLSDKAPNSDSDFRKIKHVIRVNMSPIRAPSGATLRTDSANLTVSVTCTSPVY